MAITPFPIPLRAASDVAAPEDSLNFMEMPATANAFQMPGVPYEASPEALRAAADLLERFNAQITNHPHFDLMQESEAVRAVLNDVLSEGEVLARVAFKKQCDNWRNISVQESAFTGLWRVREFNAKGDEIGNWIEAGELPQVLVDTALAAAQPTLPKLPVPEGVMNAPALLGEIAAHLSTLTPTTPAHVINLTLLPLAPADYDALLQALPVGPVAIISHSFGSCRVTSTGVQNVWRVQHFNHKEALILNTIEVVHCPQAILAAADDLADTQVRLGELIAWMRQNADDAS